MNNWMKSNVMFVTWTNSPNHRQIIRNSNFVGRQNDIDDMWTVKLTSCWLNWTVSDCCDYVKKVPRNFISTLFHSGSVNFIIFKEIVRISNYLFANSGANYWISFWVRVIWVNSIRTFLFSTHFSRLNLHAGAELWLSDTEYRKQ